MSNKEQQPEPTMLEKSIWWAKIGGVIAAFIGYVQHMAGLVTGGAIAFVGAELMQGQINKMQKNAQA